MEDRSIINNVVLLDQFVEEKLVFKNLAENQENFEERTLTEWRKQIKRVEDNLDKLLDEFNTQVEEIKTNLEIHLVSRRKDLRMKMDNLHLLGDHKEFLKNRKVLESSLTDIQFPKHFIDTAFNEKSNEQQEKDFEAKFKFLQDTYARAG